MFRQKVTTNNVFFNNGYGSEDDSDSSESEEDEESDAHEQ
jgi:hypothetical protein